MKRLLKQECIPVGCVPTAAVAWISAYLERGVCLPVGEGGVSIPVCVYGSVCPDTPLGRPPPPPPHLWVHLLLGRHSPSGQTPQADTSPSILHTPLYAPLPLAE